MGIPKRNRRLAYLLAVSMPALLTVVCLGLPSRDTAWPALAALYLAAVVFLSVWAGLTPGVLALVESSLLLDYFFIGPVDSFSIPNHYDVDTFAAFVLVGFVVVLAIAWRRAREQRLHLALALTQAQAELTRVRAASDLTELSVQTGQLSEHVTEMAYAQSSTAAALELLADRLERSGAEPRTVAAIANELRAEAAGLRPHNEART